MKRLILVTNDDGYQAKGLKALIETVKPLGEVLVVAPQNGNSGMSHSITIQNPLRLHKQHSEKGLTIYSCSGTPVDSVKLALNQLVNRKPDLLVSGINHGSNASISILYSGTMGGAIEGCVNGIDSIGFSLLNHSLNADFKLAAKYTRIIIDTVIKNKLPINTCLNVNIPDIKEIKLKGIRICKETLGVWKEEFEKRKDPSGNDYYWLTGYFKNFETNNKDTDEWALKNNYISIVPVKIDMTNYEAINKLKKWNF